MKMKKIIHLALILFLLFISHFSQAQTAEEIVDKYINKCGGVKAFSKIHSIVYSGKQNYYGLMESIMITEVQDSLQRYDINVNGQKGLWMVTRNFGAEFFPWETNALKPTIDSLRRIRPGSFKLLDKLITYKEDSSKIYLLGVFNTEKDLCYKIQLVLKNGRSRYYWFDKKTNLLTQSSIEYSFRTSQNDKMKSIDVTKYDNWQNVDGILFPFNTVTNVVVNGKNVAEKSLLLSDIYINKPVSEEAYECGGFQ
jgi:hypothetical protein